jgi:hypothetical protein
MAEEQEQQAAEPVKRDRAGERIQALVGELKAAKETIQLLQADAVTQERDALAQQLQQQAAKLEALKQSHQAQAAEWQTQATMLRRGLTSDEGQAVALALYGRLPAEERPALAEWMDGWQAEGAQMPAALAPYLQAPASPAPELPAPPKLPGRAPVGAPGALGSVDPAIRARAAAGDKEAQQALRDLLVRWKG